LVLKGHSSPILNELWTRVINLSMFFLLCYGLTTNFEVTSRASGSFSAIQCARRPYMLFRLYRKVKTFRGDLPTYLSGEDRVLEETVTRIPFSGSSDLAALAAEAKQYIFSAGDLNSLVACNDQGLVAMSAQFLLLVRVTRSLEKRVAFCESQPTHPPARWDLDRLIRLKIPLLACLVFACDRAHNLWASIPMPQPISSGGHTTSRLSGGRHGERQGAISQRLPTCKSIDS
jgi:hypothetical protein